MKDSTIPPDSNDQEGDEHQDDAPQDQPIRQDLGDVTVVFLTGETPIPQWTRKPQEQEGDYVFGGKLYVTRGVADTLSQLDLIAILTDLHQAVREYDGLDYLQVYEDGTRTVWIIDSIPKTDLENGTYTAEEREAVDHYTLLLPSEY